MSSELKTAAQQAVDAFDAFGDADDFASLFELTQKMRALRTAIQQAEAQQPATPEPVVSRNPFASRCYTMSESHLSGHRLIVGFEKLGDAQDAHEWVARQGRGDFTHPAPSVPDDVVRDAERYRFIRDADVSDDLIPDIALYAMESLDEYIDAAMLAAQDSA